MMERVKLPGGIIVGSSCLPEAPAPMKRCWARLKPSILESANAAQSGFLSRNRPTYLFMISSSGTPSSSLGRACRATLMVVLLSDTVGGSLGYCRAQRTLNHDPDQGFAVSTAGVNVVGRIDVGPRCRLILGDNRLVDRIAIEDLFDRGEPHRSVGDADDADPRVARHFAVLVVEQHRRRQRKIAVAAGKLGNAEAAARRPRGQMDLGNDFVRGQRGGERTSKKI